MSPYESAWLVSNMFSSHCENDNGTRVNGSGWLCCTLIGDHQHDVPEAGHLIAHVQMHKQVFMPIVLLFIICDTCCTQRSSLVSVLTLKCHETPG